jgi:hypothetical protein
MKRNDILTRENDIKQWIAEHRSKAFICNQLDCKPSTLETYLSKLHLDYQGNKGSRGRKSQSRKSASQYLHLGSTISTHILKLKLIEDNVKRAECESCHAKDWLNGSIPLELHHINGDRFDNRLENLKLLCPNCHALTDNHAGKGMKALLRKSNSIEIAKVVPKISNNYAVTLVFDSTKSFKYWSRIPLELRQLVNNGDGSYGCFLKSCLRCGQSLTKPEQDTYCSQKCSQLSSRRALRPSKEELEKLVWMKPTTQIANDFGVSGKAIEKWCKAYDIDKPPRGYWAKKRSLP